MHKLISASFLSLAATITFAEAPSVTSATLGDNGLEITGSGFGSENPMLFWDDVETAFKESGASIDDEVEASDTAKWGVNGNSWGSPFFYSDAVASKTGRKEVSYYGEGHKNILGKPNHPEPDSLKNKIYVSWWYKPSQHPDAEDAHNKFIRIWDDAGGQGTRISWTQVQLGASACEANWNTWDGNVNDWNHHAIYVDLANKQSKAWLNGRLVHTTTCEKNASFKDTPLYVEILGFDHGMSDYQNMTTAIKDVYIATSPARVEISNSPVWSETMDREVLPIQSWSDSTIVATPHDGLVKPSNESYIYVVNSDGVANQNGVQLNCEKCPASPPESN